MDDAGESSTPSNSNWVEGEGVRRTRSGGLATRGSIATRRKRLRMNLQRRSDTSWQKADPGQT